MFLHFRNSRNRRSNFVFTYGSEVLKIVGSYRYIGVYEFLNYRSDVSLLADSGCRALSSIVAKFKTFGNINYDAFKRLFEAGIVPIIDYCSGIWGYNDFECINNAQNRAMRFLLGVNRFVPTHALYVELVWWCMPRYRRWVNMLKLWNMLVSMPDDRLHCYGRYYSPPGSFE